jgi:DNA modification methylase
MQAQAAVQNQFINTIMQGDCIDAMRKMPANSIDFILTDPPYLVNYQDRDGRTIQNDANADWLKPAMAEAYRVLKQNRLAVMFYGWTKVDAFFDAWRAAGFQPVVTTPGKCENAESMTSGHWVKSSALDDRQCSSFSAKYGVSNRHDSDQ